ncbi:hypothetical protein FOCC_FOCC009616 [Frankliniella occidentalis]|nr:hypothetical protein FOCC_FOCC009616 [Frankliniella occidentalis]
MTARDAKVSAFKMGNSLEEWRSRIGGFTHDSRTSTQVQRGYDCSGLLLAFAITLFALLVVSGVERNPGPTPSDAASESSSTLGWLSSLEEESKTTLPANVKSILVEVGFNSLAPFSRLDKDKIDGLEIQVQKLGQIWNADDKKKFLGRFESKPEAFFFMMGERESIQILSEEARKKVRGDTPKSQEPVKRHHQKKTVRRALLPVTDLTKVEKEVTASAVKWLKEIKSTYNNVDVTVTPALGNGEENGSGEGSLVVSAHCPRCRNPRKLFQQKNGTWSLTNIQQHFRTCTGGAANSSKKRKVNNTLGSWLNQAGAEHDGSTEDDPGTVDLTSEQEPRQEESATSLPPSPSSSSQMVSTKWCENKYSRRERHRRALKRNLQSQTMITSYFPLLNRLEILIAENNELRSCLKNYVDVNRAQVPDKVVPENHGKFITDLLSAAEKNVGRSLLGRRFDSHLKLFACYIFMLGGRFLYDVLRANITELPSPVTVCRTISAAANPIVEGLFRFKELKEYLCERDLPLVVWVSEDATRITGRIQYDPRHNQVIGFELPDDENGAPVSGSFPATSAAVILSYFHKFSALSTHNAEVVMAQPVREGCPPFCLAIFGTANRFKTETVLKRWKWIQSQAAAEGIQVLGFSTDADSRRICPVAFQWSGVAGVVLHYRHSVLSKM